MEVRMTIVLFMLGIFLNKFSKNNLIGISVESLAVFNLILKIGLHRLALETDFDSSVTILFLKSYSKCNLTLRDTRYQIKIK